MDMGSHRHVHISYIEFFIRSIGEGGHVNAGWIQKSKFIKVGVSSVNPAMLRNMSLG